jgi:hypothetical protein
LVVVNRGAVNADTLALDDDDDEDDDEDMIGWVEGQWSLLRAHNLLT